MRLILANHILASEGDYRMFVRMAGTSVSQSSFSDAGYTAGESAIIIQKYGSPDYDSGYDSRVFPATVAGLEAASSTLDGIAMVRT